LFSFIIESFLTWGVGIAIDSSKFTGGLLGATGGFFIGDFDVFPF